LEVEVEVLKAVAGLERWAEWIEWTGLIGLVDLGCLNFLALALVE